MNFFFFCSFYAVLFAVRIAAMNTLKCISNPTLHTHIYLYLGASGQAIQNMNLVLGNKHFNLFILAGSMY